MNLDEQVQWISRHLTFLYIGGISFFIIGCIYLFLSTQSFIYIEVDASSNSSELTTYTSTDSETKKSDTPTGLSLVSRQTKSIIVTKGDHIKTQVEVTLPWYGYTRKNVTLHEDQNATKVAYKSTTSAECMTYSGELGTLIYYQCRDPRNILKYTAPKDALWHASSVAKVKYENKKAAPYKDGVIGISVYSASVSDISRYGVVYTDANGMTVNYNLPEEISVSSNLYNFHVFTDTNNPENKRFAIVDENGAIYLGTPEGSSVNYVTIPKPKDYTRDNNTICSITTDIATCYRGQSPVGDIEDGKRNKIAGYSIVSSRFDGSNRTSGEIKDFQESIDTIVQVGDIIYGKAYKKLFAFEKTGSYKSTELAQNVDFIAGGTKLYYIQSKGIFTYDNSKKESYQIFYSSNVTPKTMLSSENKLFFTALTKNDSQTTYAYQLIDSKNEGNRLIDVLPLKVDGAYSMDFIGNRLSVALDNVTSRSSSRQFVDQTKLSAAKDEVTARLSESGIDLNSIELEFAY